MSLNVFPRIAELLREIGHALRSLRRTPLFTSTAVGSLGLGLALAVTTLAITRAYLLRALPYPDATQLYHLRYAPPGPYEPRGMTAIDWAGLRDVVAATVISAGESYFVGDGAAPQFARGMRVSSGFITGLGVRPTLGNAFAEEDFTPGGPQVALIGEALWRQRFNGDPNIVGREIEARPENQTIEPVRLRVVGVLPPGFWFGRTSAEQPDLLLPLRVAARSYMVRLREGVPVALAERRITEAARAVGSDFRPGWAGVELESVHARYTAEVRPLLNGINAATGLVLLLVSVNVAILVLLRALRRQKELAVRVALGAERRHLWRMLLTESGIVCGLALALGVGLTALTLHTVTPWVEARLGRPPPGGAEAVAIDGAVLATTGAVALGLALALAAFPLAALRAKRLAAGLRAGGLAATDGPGARRFRSALIGLEIAGALVLLASGGLMMRSLLELVQTELGFEAAQVARIRLALPATYREGAELSEYYLKLGDRLAATGVTTAVSSSFPAFVELNTQPLAWDAGGDATLAIGTLPVGGGYFAVHGIPLRLGREFARTDGTGAEPVAIVSESLARHLWPDAPAVGRRVRLREDIAGREALGPWRTVVGVARDVRRTHADTELRDAYVPFLQAPTRFANIQTRVDRAGRVSLPQLAALASELEPFVRVYEPVLLATEDTQLARVRFMTMLLNVFAGFGAGLALLGIYGVTAFAVLQREREVVIRLALGASPRMVLGMFLREGSVVLAAGLALGLWGAFAAGKLLASQVSGVKAFDAATLLAAGALLALCGLAAIAWPARRAGRVDLLSVLKQE